MGVSDNTKGFALAVVSSAFIGSSFILKKKGLKRAGKSGTRAGQMINPRSLLPCVSGLSADGFSNTTFEELSSSVHRHSVATS
ncbi:hypothetical protein GW17_00013265 [Ensete ventricosum]|nr:hypothetical protein GW17_00013265 [Ensete ventricosum]